VPGTVLQLALHQEIIRTTATLRLPAVYGSREYVDAGGLISLGTDLEELAWRAAHVVDRILKGPGPPTSRSSSRRNSSWSSI
jgi:putative ABC transport system substrate-binding protein